MWFQKRPDTDFADEIDAHIDIETDRLIATGVTPAHAREAAVRAFGNRTAARERFHASRGWMLFEHLVQDLRYAARSMRRTPAFALGATLCLAIGISVNTAAFSVLNAVLFRDYPGVVEQRELASVKIGWDASWGRASPSSASMIDWELLRDGMTVFSGVAAFSNMQLAVGVDGEPQAMRGALISNSYFDVLGTRPAAGRFITQHDDPRDAEQSVVISYGFWKRKFNLRDDIVGRVVTVGTRSFTIIGVAPEGFFGLYPGEIVDPDIGAAEIFVPLAAASFLRPGIGASAHAPASVLDDRWLQVVGRLRAGATLADAERQANAMAVQLASQYPVERKNAFAEVRVAGDRAKDTVEMVSAMVFVMAVPAIILLVACANLANQLLARAIQRSREIAVRLSLGATRGRVVRQLLAETALLAIVASGLGILFARWLLDAVRAFVLAIPFRIPVDGRVLLFTIGLALVTALAFGLVPALRATRTDLTSALKDGAPGSGYHRSRLRNALVITQIAASLALVALSTVFVQAGQRPPSAALDALANRALLVSMNLDLLGFDSVSGRAYQQSVMERVGNLPGVSAVGMAPFSMFEMLGGEEMTQPDEAASRKEYNDVAPVSGAWFEATNTKPIRGRLFSPAEQVGRPTVAVVDEALARELWGRSEAIGRTLRIGADSVATIVTVVGVVPERREVTFRQAEGVVFVPGTWRYNPRTYFYVRTTGDAQQLMPGIRHAIRALDARVPVLWVRTLEDVGAREVAEMTMLASGLASLGSVAFALAALGLFGVLSFLVAQRKYEIGVRVALGARRMDITWLVLRQALGLGASGVAAGAIIALAAVALIRAIIYGLQPLDPLVLGEMSVAMVVVALLASALPARRAASVDPMIALRGD